MNLANSMMLRRRRRTRGQTLVLFALMSVVLFGFAGLALDAGHIYLVYRLAQNATDSAALAGGKRLGAAIRTQQPSGSSDSSGMPLAVHDYALANGYTTTFSTSCDSTVVGSPRVGLTQFTTSWVDAGTCASGFNTKITVTSPPQTLTPDCNNVPYNCMQVQITRVVSNFLMGVLGIPTTSITTSATVLALPPGNVATMPPSIAVYLYQPDINPPGPCTGPPGQCKKAATVPQWFDPTIPPSRTQLSCSVANGSCPTFWSQPTTCISGTCGTLITGIDGHNIPTGDTVALESNGSMVIQDPTTFCDPYAGSCSSGSVVGLKGFALNAGKTLYCSSPAAQAPIACTTTGPGSAALNANYGNETSYSTFSWSPVITAPTNVCGSLVLDGDTVANSGGNGSCNPPAADPYLIVPGVYGSIVINHGTYEFGPGVFQITGTAPVSNAAAGTKANGIDFTGETNADWDLCPTGSCPGWNPPVGIWIGHGNTPSVAGSGGSSESCGDGSSSGPNTGGGDQTVISGSGVTFQFTATSGGFVSTNEVQSIQLSSPGLGTQPATGGVPILFDMENSNFIHLDAKTTGGGGGDDGGDDGGGSGNPTSQYVGMIYQTTSANAGGVEMDPGLGGRNAGFRGQILAYTFTTFGTSGPAVNFTAGFGVGSGPPATSTGGFNETSIYGTPAATLTAAATPGFQTLTWHYTDEWKLDAFSAYVKVNNTTPVYFSQGIWSPAPAAGVPLPPAGNTPGETSPAYPNIAQDPGNKYTHTSTSNNSSDWTIKYADNSTFELNGAWVWGHENSISGSNNGTNNVLAKYTFPTPAGAQSTVTIFMSDGDRCGDWVTVTATLTNAGAFNPGQQVSGNVSLEQ
jgi:Flp pilus assembly protein TadG